MHFIASLAVFSMSIPKVLSNSIRSRFHKINATGIFIHLNMFTVGRQSYGNNRRVMVERILLLQVDQYYYENLLPNIFSHNLKKIFVVNKPI